MCTPACITTCIHGKITKAVGESPVFRRPKDVIKPWGPGNRGRRRRGLKVGSVVNTDTSRLDALLTANTLTVDESDAEMCGDIGANTPSPPDSPEESLALRASNIAERDTNAQVKKRLLFRGSGPSETGREYTDEEVAEVRPPDDLTSRSPLMSLLEASAETTVIDTRTSAMADGGATSANVAAPLETCTPPSVVHDGSRVTPQLPKTWSSTWQKTDTQKRLALTWTPNPPTESTTQETGTGNTPILADDVVTPKKAQPPTPAHSQTRLAKANSDTDRKRAKAVTPKEPSAMRTPVKESTEENGQKRKHTQQPR